MDLDAKLAVYRMHVEGEVSRTTAQRIIGDDWETVKQVGSIRRARAVNRESGYSAGELAEVFG